MAWDISFGAMLFLLMILGTHTGHLAAEVLEDAHPTTFTPVGTLILSGSHYIVPLQLNITSLLARVEPLSLALSKVSTHFESLSGLMGGGNSSQKSQGGTLEHFPESLRSHTMLLITDLNHLRNRLRFYWEWASLPIWGGGLHHL